VLCDAAYTTHTYKHTTMGFLADIQAMPEQGEYAKVFFDRWYRPEYATVMLVGDVDPKTAIPLVEKHFGSWKRGFVQGRGPAGTGAAGPEVRARGLAVADGAAGHGCVPRSGLQRIEQ
jgi:zinc protease